MKTSSALVVLTATLSLGCASAPMYAPPETSAFSITSEARIEAGGLSAQEVLDYVPVALARYGYFIAKTEQLAPDRYKLVTDWRAELGSPARTRLLLDLRRRGNSYALSIEGVRTIEDVTGGWHEAEPTPDMVRSVRAIERDFRLRSR